jgi:hypothetical protein
MPRNRMIKPDFWNDEKLGSDIEAVQLTFVGTWNFSDDYGVVRANPVWLKNQIFPYKQSLRMDVFSKWLEALEGHDALIPFTVRGERFYFIRTFRLHQSVEKPSKTRNCTEDELRQALDLLGYAEQSDRTWKKSDEELGNGRGVFPPEDKLSEVKLSKVNGAKALVPTSRDDAQAGRNVLKKKYDELSQSLSGQEKVVIWNGVKDFIALEKPDFPEPFVDAWNVFALTYKLSRVDVISDSRRKKFSTRIQELPAFDFLKILEKIKVSNHLRGDNQRNWKVTFDWVVENDKNYLKILEGNYD